MKEVSDVLTTAFTHNRESGKKKKRNEAALQHSAHYERLAAGEREDVWYPG